MTVGTREPKANLDPRGGSTGASIGADSPSGTPAWASKCLNCGAAISGDYCSSCGQRVLPPDPTIRELAGDAFSEFSGWDGKFLRTLQLLIIRPGELTHRFLAGQRVRFISPLRVYLTCSFVYFALKVLAPAPNVVAANGTFMVANGVAVGMAYDVRGGAAAAPKAGLAALSAAINQGLSRVDPATRAAAEREIGKAPPVIRTIVHALAVDQKTLRGHVTDAMPRALFILIPGVALALGLFYRRRHYPEHIYFAMHFEAFFFLMFALHPLAELTGSGTVMSLVQFATTAAIVVYAVVALRRVYGGAWGRTVAKGAGVAAISALIWLLTVMSVVYWSASRMLAGVS